MATAGLSMRARPAILAVAGLAMLGACGLEAPPEQPEPAPAEEEEASRATSGGPRVTVGADGYVGAAGNL